MYNRLLNLSKKHSFFLFGMRGVGKSSLLQGVFGGPDTLWIDLLLAENEFKYKGNPDRLKAEVEALIAEGKRPTCVVIDEIQKVPNLLDIVHHLIERHRLVFALTGSSARKLKRGSANLLAGRAFVYHLFPLSYLELDKDFNLQSHLVWGGLPALCGEDLRDPADKNRFLKAYVHTYLKEEILVEQLVRHIDPFYAFLDVSAQMNGEILNFSKIARDANSDDKSVERYYSILEDTLLGFHLMPYHESVRKQQVKRSKFYYFDTGLVRALKGHTDFSLHPSTYEYGKLFESFIVSEIFKLNEYFEKGYKLSFLKTKEGVEIDLIITVSPQKKYCVEIKAGEVKEFSAFQTARKLADSIPNASYIVLSQNKQAMRGEGIEVLPWQTGIQKIFDLS